MPTANLNNSVREISTGNDSIVIVEFLEGVPGGRTLDVTGFTPEVIPAGHILIKDASGNYKPMPVSGAAYAALPADHTYAGVNVATIPTAKAFAGIMVRGTVNPAASAYTITSILSAVKTALPLIRFEQD